MSECIGPIRFEEEEEVTCAGYKYNDCFSYGDKELERGLIANNDMKLQVNRFIIVSVTVISRIGHLVRVFLGTFIQTKY